MENNNVTNRRIAERRAAESGMGHSVMDSADELRKEWQLNGRPAGGQGAVPEGWQIARLSDTKLRVSMEGDASAVVRESDHATNIPAYVLYALASDLLAAPVPALAAPGEALTDSSMPVDMSQAKRWVTQLRARVDTLLAIINEKSPASSERAPEPSVGSVADDRQFQWFIGGLVNEEYDNYMEFVTKFAQYIDSLISARTGAVGLTDESQYQEDPMDIVRSFVCIADRMKQLSDAQREHYPSPLADYSPIMMSARNACVERGFTEGGLSLADQVSGQKESA
jgi:hypothetical protein